MKSKKLTSILNTVLKEYCTWHILDQFITIYTLRTMNIYIIEIYIFSNVLYDKFIITERSAVDIACENSN